MKNKNLYISVLILALCGYSVYAAKNTTNAQSYQCEERENEVIYCLNEEGKPLTDKWYRYASNGQRSSIENFKNGYRDGLCTFFDKSGYVSERMYYKRGLKNGMYKKYYANRTKQIETNYDEGLLDGRLDLYYLNGQLRGRMTYKKGKLQRGYCVDTEGNKVRFNSQEIAKYQDNNINMCGLPS